MKTKKNLITALKKLVTSFGGEAKSNNTVDLVDEFAEIAAQSSGSDDLFIVTIDEDGGTITADKIAEEIVNAFLSGKTMVAKRWGTSFSPMMTIAVDHEGILVAVEFGYYINGDEGWVVAGEVDPETGEIAWRIYEI